MNEKFLELKNEIYELNEQQQGIFVHALMGSFEYYFENESEIIDKKKVLQSLSVALKYSK